MTFINRINNNIILDIAIQVLPDSKKKIAETKQFILF